MASQSQLRIFGTFLCLAMQGPRATSPRHSSGCGPALIIVVHVAHGFSRETRPPLSPSQRPACHQTPLRLLLVVKQLWRLMIQSRRCVRMRLRESDARTG